MDGKLQQFIDNSKNIVFFGGAGVSTESGIPDFRSVDGLYNTQYKYPPETIVSHSFFMENTEEFYKFYLDKLISDAQPNKAHKKLAEMEANRKLRGIVTQNIDGLHQMAGSINVQEIHGSVHNNYCMECNTFYSLDDVVLGIKQSGIPKCKCGGIIKPDVVLYEEELKEEVTTKAVNLIKKADLLIVGGTSLNVYPAAGFISCFKGEYLVLINNTKTPIDTLATLVIRENIGEVLDGIKI